MKTLKLLGLFLLFTSMLHAQLVLERDINQEPAWSSPDYCASLNNILYFIADDGIHGDELYQYDLTTQTAQLVADIRPYEIGSGISEVIAFDDKIYFNARDGSGSNRYLYVYDPNDNSTQRLSDIENTQVKNPGNFKVFNGQLFFGAEFPNIGSELGRYDPVTNKVDILGDLNTSGNSSPNFFTEVDGKLWFTATGDQSNSRLWRYDPLTEMVENIVYQSPNAVYPSMSFLYYFDGKFFFQGFLQGQGEELWIYDVATNSLLDFPQISPGPGSSSPSNFIEFAGKLYLSARTNASGRELMVYDLATEAVSLVADIYPGGNGNPGLMLTLNGKLYFTASINELERKLFSYSSNGNGPNVEATLENNGGPNYLSSLIVANGNIFLAGVQTEVGYEFFRFTPGNPVLALAADINQTTLGSDPYLFTPYNGKLYFGATEFNSGQEIWVYDPITGSTDILSDTPGSLNPYDFTVLGGKLYFSGIAPNLGYGLLYYDDATGNIEPTSFITPSNTGHITDITAYGDKLYFKAYDETLGNELYVYNPANNTFALVADLNPNDGANPDNLFVYENILYFQASDGTSGNELWKLDGNGQVTQVADINPGSDSSNPSDFTVYNGEMYFSAYTPEASYQVFSYNATTGAITQRTNVSGNLDPQDLTVYHDKLFFNGRFPSGVNAELGYYDAATNETLLTEDINPGGSNPYDLTVFNDKLYFSTFTDQYGRELWVYNDTTLAIIADIRSGVPDSDPEFLTLFNDKLYLSANDGLRGKEIWSLAACLNLFVDTEPQIGENGFGSIDLTVQGGLPPYTYNWSTGSQSEDLINLEPGTYMVTVSDASGCLSELTAEVTFVSHTENLISEDLVELSPNPNAGSFSLKMDGLAAKSVEVFDLNGSLLYQKLINSRDSVIDVNLRYAPAGMYVVNIRTAEGLIRKKVVIK